MTTIGFGAWSIGGGWSYGWGPQDDADSLAAMRHALARGINWIDTAAVHGLGRSEERVGRPSRELSASERPRVFTKCGLLWGENDPMAEPRSRPHLRLRDALPPIARRQATNVSGVAIARVLACPEKERGDRGPHRRCRSTAGSRRPAWR